MDQFASIWSVRADPEAVSTDEGNATRGTYVFFRQVQSNYVIAPDHPRGAEMLAIVREAIGKTPIEVVLDDSKAQILDVRTIGGGSE